jgi:hypothetical protein
MSQAAIDELKTLAGIEPAERERYAATYAEKRIWIMPDRLPVVHQVVNL